ncbi:MAG TPA: prohibitin family protein [Myxococcaceae bacterium]|jgi:regulator of protease activity HflC (stomatin/prohibitin superfamily)|nr:prohibitin family protein [Myxococcaceae bacterium]
MRRILTAALVLTGCVTVPPGHAGVLWKASGGTQPQPYGEGEYTVWFANHMSVYDLRVMSKDEKLDVIASNGLSIRLDASVRFRINPSEVVQLQEEIGPDYYETILEPLVRSDARRVVGQYTPEEIYSTKRDVIEREIREQLIQRAKGMHLLVEAVLIRNVELPQAIRQAIDQKLAAEQEVLKMQYVLQTTRLLADQRRVEAEGIADYNRTVAKSLSSPILEFERIQQLEKLAASPNAKTVVLGPGTGQTPLMLSSPGAAGH